MDANEIVQIAISSVIGVSVSKEQASKIVVTMIHLKEENYSVTIKELNQIKK